MALNHLHALMSKLQGTKQLPVALKSPKVNSACSVKRSEQVLLYACIVVTAEVWTDDLHTVSQLQSHLFVTCSVVLGLQFYEQCFPGLPAGPHSVKLANGRQEEERRCLSCSLAPAVQLRALWKLSAPLAPTPAMGWSRAPWDSTCFQKLLTLGLLQQFLSVSFTLQSHVNNTPHEIPLLEILILASVLLTKS